MTAVARYHGLNFFACNHLGLAPEASEAHKCLVRNIGATLSFISDRKAWTRIFSIVDSFKILITHPKS